MHREPAIVVTGASGFLGRHLLGALRPDRRVVAIDRLSQGEAEIAEHPNLRWYQIDLADAVALRDVFGEIRRWGGARALVHLAAYYDCTGEPNPEYERTNVRATRLVLENSKDLGLRRFIFSSSIAACPFSSPGHPITEDTPPDGKHVYAVSKRAGEEMLREHAAYFPTCSVRFAALFSDWCQYPPLYSFLETWLSERWKGRILGGRGESAIPFLHVRDATDFVLRLLERLDDLEREEVLLASTDGATSHNQLYETAIACHFGEKRQAIRVPRWLCGPGIRTLDLAGRLLGDRPFERPWMARYVDRSLEIDASRTRQKLGWSPRSSLGILERIPFMIEHRGADPVQWHGRNR